MAGRMISELSDAITLQNTDLIPLARGATTLKVSGLTLVNSLTSSASGAFASKTDLTSLSSTVDANFALKTSITSLSSTVDTNFIPKPASASAQQVLTYNGSTTTWVASAAPNGSTGPTSAKAWVNFDGTDILANISGTYSQSGTTVTVTIAGGHGLSQGQGIYSNITSGTAVDGSYTVASITSPTIFTYTAGTSLTTSGNITLNRSSIRSQYNVSSVTKNGTGDYTVNFATPMADANYCVTGTTNRNVDPSNNSIGVKPGVSPTTSAVRLTTGDYNSNQDTIQNSIAIFGN